jgi:thiamine-phosphate pyrophosphorylase
MVQYRHKTASPELRREQAQALLALCRTFGRPLIINDHLALCLELDAAGVHVGGTDVSPAQARAALGPAKIVGASCYGDLQRARVAQAEGASYVAFGGFYPSTKKAYGFRTDAALVTQACRALRVPVAVIGGLSAARAAPLVARGAHMAAAISAIYDAPDAGRAAAEFAALFSVAQTSSISGNSTL